MAQLRMTAPGFKTEVDKRRHAEFILDRGGEFQAAVPGLSQDDLVQRRHSRRVDRPSLLEFIQKQVPDFDSQGFICLNDLGRFRRDYVKEVLEDEIGELSTLDQEVIDSLQEHEILSENIGKEFEQELTFGERLSDRIASFGGSWTFIIIFFAVLMIWIAINSIILATRAFDPYPFILMNLILSCLAAIQAPIIMMSQNRAEARVQYLNGVTIDFKSNFQESGFAFENPNATGGCGCGTSFTV